MGGTSQAAADRPHDAPGTADRLGRPLQDLRVSVTDRCNLRCGYCMPKDVFGPGFQFLASAEMLTFEEVARVVTACARHGVEKVRLTGGEPLLRRDLPRLVAMLADVKGIRDIALTTNGLLLARRAQALADAGLSRVTVSLDSLDADVVHEMSGMPLNPRRVLEGIDAAAAAGLAEIKVNMVVRRGVNDRCVTVMAEHFRWRGQTLRFIEYMDVGSTNGWREQDVVPAAEIIEELGKRWPLQALPAARLGEVATRYRYRDGAGDVGVISSVSEPFCGQCTRARLSADGKLYTCLFAHAGNDLRALLRGGGGERELESRIAAIWGLREDRYSAERSLAATRRRGVRSRDARGAAPGLERVPPKVEMSYIGG